MNDDKIIEQLFDILTELDARNKCNNCVVSSLEHKSWTEICDEAIELLEQIK